MGLIDDINQMRNQGISDEDIFANLQSQGISPQVIGDAINQAEIKNAVTNQGEYSQDDEYQNQGYGNQQSGNMRAQEIDENTYMPQEQGYQEYYPQEQYGGYEQSVGGGGDTSTMIEIAEQVLSEKTQKIQKQLRELSEFKTLMETSMEHLTERVKRVENMMDKTQMAILDKVGSYGKGLENVKKEVGMMQDSFSKMVPSLAAKHHTKHGNSAHKKSAKKTSKRK
jgi:hypothetical protein